MKQVRGTGLQTDETSLRVTGLQTEETGLRGTGLLWLTGLQRLTSELNSNK